MPKYRHLTKCRRRKFGRDSMISLCGARREEVGLEYDARGRSVAERIRPFVHLLFACDEAVYDTATDRWVLTHPWHAVSLPPEASFPFRSDEFWVSSQLTDGLGKFELGVELRHLLDDQPPRVIGWSRIDSFSFSGANRLAATDTAFPLRHVPFREAGLYEIRILADGDVPDSWEPLPGLTYEFRVLDRRPIV
jgi:hypothetical protein